jgi:hypothetical protein
MFSFTARRKSKMTTHFAGAPGRNRTYDSRIRNPVLYPLSYEGNMMELLDRSAINIISTGERQGPISLMKRGSARQVVNTPYR